MLRRISQLRICHHAAHRHAAGHAEFTSSAIPGWRSKEERQQALHRRDGDPVIQESRNRSASGRRNSEYSREATYSREQQPPRKLRTNRRDNQQSLGVFDSPQHAAANHIRPPVTTSKKSHVPKSINKQEDPKRGEVRDKIQRSIAAVKDLPPLTDQDFQNIYADLVSYDSAPSSPSQLQLSSSSAHQEALASPFQAMQASIKDRVKELRARLESRFPVASAGKGGVSETGGVAEDGPVSELLSQLRQMNLDPNAKHEEPELLYIGGKPGQPATNQSSDPVLGTRVIADERQDGSTRGRTDFSTQGLSDRKAILKMLDALLPKSTTNVQKGKASSQADIATSQEWAALILQAAKEGDIQDLILAVDAMKRAGSDVDDELLIAALKSIPEMRAQGPARTQVLLRYLDEAQITVPSSVHHEIISSILRRHLTRENIAHCERYLRTLEEASTPALPETYALVLFSIFKARNVLPHARQRAWNLFGHARLVVHPIPSVEMYNAMIYGCSLDDKVAPERALDLFIELIESGITPNYETYHSLIRSCSRASQDIFYFEALRLLKELLERNFRPERDIFNVLLEGMRSRADLERAKWIVRNMAKLAEKGEETLQPDDRTIANLFLTFATYRPSSSTLAKLNNNAQAASSGEEVKQQRGQSDSRQSQQTQAPTTPHQQPESGQDDAGPLQIVQGESSDIFDYTVPVNNDQIVEQVTSIMSAILRAKGLDPSILEKLETGESYSAEDKAQIDKLHNIKRKAEAQNAASRTPSPSSSSATDEVLFRIPITAQLLDSYLTVLCAHTAIWRPYAFFRNAHPALNIHPSYKTWEILFDRLDKPGKQRVWRVEKARVLFEEWKDWVGGLSKRMMGEEGKLNWWNPHIQLIWSRMIGIEAKAHTVKQKLNADNDEADENYLDSSMQLLEDFVRRYPPEDIVHQAKSQAESRAIISDDEPASDTSTPGYLAEMSSFLYPETSDTDPITSSQTIHDGETKLPPAPSSSLPKTHYSSDKYGTPPHVTFASVYPLFHRFRELEDKRYEKVSRITGKYAAALREAEEIRNRDKEGEKRKVKEARKRLILGQRDGEQKNHKRMLDDAEAKDQRSLTDL